MEIRKKWGKCEGSSNNVANSKSLRPRLSKSGDIFCYFGKPTSSLIYVASYDDDSDEGDFDHDDKDDDFVDDDEVAAPSKIYCCHREVYEL